MPSSSKIIPMKAGIFGGQGSGKSTTAALLAAALSKEISCGAPIFVTDTEPAWQFLRPRIFAPEKIELITRKVPTFQGLLHDIRDAQQEGACCWVGDQITVIWQELLQSFKAKNNGFIPINVWGDIRQMWNEYVTAFRNSKMHCIAIGRLGNVMEEVQDEQNDGRTKLVKTGTAFKAGGSESFGYEPDFLIELSLERKAKKIRGEERDGEGRMIHRADVLKDRTWALNGRVFRWGDKPRYMPGGYRAVWDDLKPHFDAVQLTGEHSQLEEGSSVEILGGDDGRSDYYRQQRLRQSCLEDWDATMELLWPGTAAAMRKNRAIVGEAITGVRSRTRFESFPVAEIQRCVGILFALERRLKNSRETFSSDAELAALAELARQDFDTPQHPGKDLTLLEILAKRSVEEATAKRKGDVMLTFTPSDGKKGVESVKPQPAVTLIEQAEPF